LNNTFRTSKLTIFFFQIISIFQLVLKTSNDEGWIGLTKHYSRGFEWADSSAVNFLSWATGEPSEVALGEADCAEMNKAGNWNNRDCNRKKLPSVCSHARKWSNCQIAEGEKEPCGYAGVTESVNFESDKKILTKIQKLFS